ncbi:hypothetical protein M885DRAFT_566292 [Pelagophyceae sp. CCMP2097]|nr:hypothetical protein M885DRAFT_566292 [Pelagophyceae sp. CCMP2097]
MDVLLRGLVHLDGLGGTAEARSARAMHTKEVQLFGAIAGRDAATVLDLLAGENAVDPNAKPRGLAEYPGLRGELGAFGGTAVEFALFIGAPPLIASPTGVSMLAYFGGHPRHNAAFGGQLLTQDCDAAVPTYDGWLLPAENDAAEARAVIGVYSRRDGDLWSWFLHNEVLVAEHVPIHHKYLVELLTAARQTQKHWAAVPNLRQAVLTQLLDNADGGE